MLHVGSRIPITSGGGSCVSGAWMRNEDWNLMPDVDASDEQFYGLYLVYEDEYNQAHFEINFTTSASFDWGDGTTGTPTSGVKESHVYDYSTLSKTVYVDEYGRNYKQVMVDISGVDVTAFEMDFAPTYNKGGTQSFVDIECSFPNATIVNFNNSNWTFLKMARLERLKIHAWKSPVATWSSQLYAGAKRLAVLEIPFDQLVTTSSFMRDAGTHFLELGDITWSALTTANSLFYLSGTKSIGNQTFTLATTLKSCFGGCANLTSVGDITAPIATAMNTCFMYSNRVEYIGDIDAPNVTTIHSVCSGLSLLRRFVMLDASSVTSTTNAFNGAPLSECLLPGITVGFNLSNANMQKTEIDAMFTALGTASGTQTITVTGNPGAATCDTSIATAKGWTIAI